MDAPRPSPLLEAFFARRDDLRRYFSARLGSPEAAEDLVQDVYLRLQAVTAEVDSPAAYLYRLGSNLMLDRLKKERRSRGRDEAWRRTRMSPSDDEAADEPAADDALAARQQLELIIEALNDLSPACRRAFRLHKFEGLSHAETALAMGISRSGVEKHISAALKHLSARIVR